MKYLIFLLLFCSCRKYTKGPIIDKTFEAKHRHAYRVTINTNKGLTTRPASKIIPDRYWITINDTANKRQVTEILTSECAANYNIGDLYDEQHLKCEQ